MRILVTGHQGYIGTSLTPQLLSAGHQVVGIDTDLFVAGTLGPCKQNFTSLHQDIRDVEVEDLKGFDAVIHLAGISNDPLGDLNPDVTMDINYHASVHLAKVAKEAKVNRFLFASSCSLYGAHSAGDSLDETAEFRPVTPYGESKILVEKALSGLASSDFSPTYLRCATAFGYSPRLRADLVVNNLTGYASLTGEVLLKSDGTAWRPLVHIDDISSAYLGLLNAPRQVVHNQPFNVGRTAENYQIREVANFVKEIVPNSKVEFAAGAGTDKRCYNVTFKKLENNISGYQPRWTVKRGISQLLKAYQDFNLTYQDFTGTKYLRIKQVKESIEKNRIDNSLRVLDNPSILKMPSRRAQSKNINPISIAR